MTSSGYVAIPRCPVIFDGINYTDFVAHMRIHTRGLGLLGALFGEVPCPPSPVQPVEPSLPVPLTVDPTASQDIVAAAKKADDAAVVAYEQRLFDYKLLAAYTHWMDADARASAVLVSSVLPQFSSEIVGFSSAFQMWTHRGAALYLSVVRQEHELRQGDATIDEFYSRSSAIWRQLDSLCSTTCGTCACCQTARADKEFHRLYEFLSRLRKEFEPQRARLFARVPRVTLLEALTELRAEETRLRGAGLLEIPTVLTARPPATPATPCSSASAPLLPTPAGGSRPPSGGGRPHCTYCEKDGHSYSSCFRQKQELSRGSSSSGTGLSTSTSASTSSALSSIEQEIARLRRMLAAAGSPSAGSAGSATESSSTERPPPQLGTVPWILDSGASFHMTSDSSILSPLRPLDSPVHVLTADGTSLLVASQGILSNPTFHVSLVAHVPRLTMQLLSAGQLTDSGCHSRR